MVHDRFLTLCNLEFHYREWSARGAPLVFLHGLASQAHMFDRVAPRLADSYRVLALDQRGHGLSAKPDTGYDFATVSADLAAFLDALRLRRVVVAGHSWGGNVALSFAAHYPERTRALVLIDGGFLDIQSNPAMTWERTARDLAPPRLAGTPLDEFKQRLRAYAGKHWTPTLEAVILENFDILPDRTIRPHLSFENHMKILRALWEQRPPELYGRVRCPALIVPACMNGEDPDWAKRRRAQVQAAARGIPHNRVVWFRDTVHDIPLHRPRKLANVIARFLRAQDEY